MQITVLQDLRVKRFDGRFPTPWLGSGRPRWELIRDFIILLNSQRFRVPKGYVFDGSSVPRFLWFLYPPGYAPAWRGSCFHDYGLSHRYKEYPQEFWDQLLRGFILHDGGSTLTANLFKWAVSRAPRGGYRDRN